MAFEHRFHHHIDDEPVAKCTRSSDAHHSVRGWDTHSSRHHPAERRILGNCRFDCVERLHLLRRQIQSNLRRDHRQRAADVASKAEECLQAHQIHEAYRTIQGWYKERTSAPSKPTPDDLDDTSTVYENLYSNVPSHGPLLPLNVVPFNIPDGLANEDEILDALLSLQKRRAPGPSGITVEELLH